MCHGVHASKATVEKQATIKINGKMFTSKIDIQHVNLEFYLSQGRN